MGREIPKGSRDSEVTTLSNFEIQSDQTVAKRRHLPIAHNHAFDCLHFRRTLNDLAHQRNICDEEKRRSISGIRRSMERVDQWKPAISGIRRSVELAD